ncbi:MAG: siphovirus Gp157 family protein [Fusobacterium necrophorum]|nr:siphovirus Gp157 family protein [Fusobacterium necrophorum]
MELSLYGITEEMRNLDILWEMAIDEETGEIMDGDVLEQLQNEIGIYLQNKSAGIIKYYKSRDYFIDAVDQEIKKLQALKKASQNKQENFKKYIKMCMEKMGLSKIETENGTLSLRKSEAVLIENERIIPTEFTTIVQETKISKTEIKKAIKSGKVIPGASLVENRSLVVK